MNHLKTVNILRLSANNKHRALLMAIYTKRTNTEWTFRSLLILIGYVQDMVGRNSVVGIATRYGLDGPGIESR
jgi:hypothetical protein